ncbi:hypothetical protein [Desulfoluna sp.]|uniref:hypothetical protein n=1 Tax=Desulfoluna sp. TaxID=2045199 RepID=UPI00261D4865|nr:hypothetical protein [Desulfoluna sp.]
MPSENVIYFFWPEMNITVSVAALVLALAVFVFGAFSGVRANKIRIIFAVVLAALLGGLTMPLAVKMASVLHLVNTKAGVVILVTAMMVFVAALATSIYEIVTVTFPDIGMASKK